MKFKASKAQILVTGVYRTGSEYFSHLLNSFSEVSSSMYRVNLMRFIYEKYNPINCYSNLNKALDDLQNRLMERYSMKINKGNFLERINLKNFNYAILYDNLMTFLYLEKSKATIWAEKCQLVWRQSIQFITMMNNGKVILIHRDPRSVLASFKNYTTASRPLYLGSIFNSLDSMSYGLDCEKKYPDKFLNVRYEDIVLNETDTMERIASFIGLKNTNYNFDSTNLCDAYGNPWYSNSSFESNDSSSSFDVQSSIQRWKSNLSQSEVKLTEMICADVMQHYEYFPSLSTATDDSVYNLLRGNEVTEGYLKNFLNTGCGIQSFPSDPLDPRNWEKN